MENIEKRGLPKYFTFYVESVKEKVLEEYNEFVDENTKCATPVASPAAGTYDAAQSVILTTSTTGADVYYTIDGSTPTSSSTKYTSAISISETTTIKAIAIKTGKPDSDVLTAAYVIS